MNDRTRKILLIGYGNPGRLDDGLGPALAAEIEQLALPGVTVDSDYQLTIEDAAAIAGHDVVVFADAAVSGPAPFYFERIRPKPAMSFSSHSVEPPAVMALAEELFGSRAPGYCLGIRGYEFNEYREQLSPQARENLAAAIEFIVATFRMDDFDQAAAAHGRAPAHNPIASSGDTQCKTENT